MYVNLVLKKKKYILGRIGLTFGGFGEQLNYFWGFGEHKQNTFRELRQKKSGTWGDQSIIFRELGSKDDHQLSPGGPSNDVLWFSVVCF